MNFPFTTQWIFSRCIDYCNTIKVKGSNYKKIRKNIQNLCTLFKFIKIPIQNIIVLKNYYSKNKIVISIKSFFNGKNCIFIIDKSNVEYYVPDKKNFNVFEEFKNAI